MFAKRALLAAMKDDDSSGRRRKDRAQKIVEHDVLGMYFRISVNCKLGYCCSFVLHARLVSESNI